MVHRVAVVFDLRTSAMRYKIEVFVNMTLSERFDQTIQKET